MREEQRYDKDDIIRTAGPNPLFRERQNGRRSRGQEIVTIENNETGFYHKTSPDSPSCVLGLKRGFRGGVYA